MGAPLTESYPWRFPMGLPIFAHHWRSVCFQVESAQAARLLTPRNVTRNVNDTDCFALHAHVRCRRTSVHGRSRRCKYRLKYKYGLKYRPFRSK